jgi:molybdopterin-containing oxidoreductase family iron-sulfur binding subunit
MFDAIRKRLDIIGQAPVSEERDESVEPGLAEAMERVQLTRRTFLERVGLSAGATAAATAATGCGAGGAWETFFQQHYKRLSDEDKQVIFARLEAQVMERHGVEVTIGDPQPLDGVEFGYALNVSVCTGCRQCEYACAQENNTSRDPEMHYIRVMELDRTFDVERSVHDYDGEVPQPGKMYMPVQCHQCENAPCVTACPVNATWRERDGIVVVDYDWCIGCRYCETACPYEARRFNFSEPSIAAGDINPNQGYLSNRLRKAGVVEKCHFCLHRVREGLNPACLEACPVGARKFGNLLDPESELRSILEEKRIYVLKEEQGTLPRFFYYFE